jgi:putative endonuclease
MPSNLGQCGESVAAEHLRAKNYEIIARNWRCAYGEIDLVARKDELLVFVEVKTRHSNDTESALASISVSKREKLITTVHHYLAELDVTEPLWRFDVIAVAFRQNKISAIDHVENAFDWE